MRGLVVALVTAIAVAGCSAPEAGDGVALEQIDAAGFAEIVEESDRPVVVNFWASWCIPCRSEAPLLVAAHQRFGDEVRFIGVATDDQAEAAAGFLQEFGLTFENFLDVPGSVQADLVGGGGLPMTVFISADGATVRTHYGAIDEGALALGIDEAVLSN